MSERKKILARISAYQIFKWQILVLVIKILYCSCLLLVSFSNTLIIAHSKKRVFISTIEMSLLNNPLRGSTQHLIWTQDSWFHNIFLAHSSRTSNELKLATAHLSCCWSLTSHNWPELDAFFQSSLVMNNHVERKKAIWWHLNMTNLKLETVHLLVLQLYIFCVCLPHWYFFSCLI